MTSPRKPAREYLRVSLDRSGYARSLDEQHTDNERAAAEHGWTLGSAYRDESVSASRYSHKARGGFAALVADLESGRFGADVLVIWESSRGSRRVSEWVELIELCEKRAVSIYVTTHHRLYDPANGRDRRSLLEDSVDSEYESSKISERTRRSAAARARDGRPVSRTPYGYQRVRDPGTGRIARQEPNPDEAPVVQELFSRVLAGHSLRSIAKDFKLRGIRSRNGYVHSSQMLRSIALNRAYNGERVHIPGRANGQREELRTPAQWEALVDKATFNGVQRILTAPERRTSRPGRGVHLLSMIARCAVCSGSLAAARRDGWRWVYQCQDGGHVRINHDELDTLAEQSMLDFLARPDVREGLTADTGDDVALAAVRDELAEVRARADELADAVAAGTLTVQFAARSEPKLLAQITDLERQEADLCTPNALRGLMAPGADVQERWHQAPMSTRREVARLLLGADGLLGELRVKRGRGLPVAERVELGATGSDKR